MDTLLARVQAWIADDPEPGTVQALTLLTYRVQDGDPVAVAELTGLFGPPLAYGPAGLRGRVQPGPAGLNRRNVQRAAAGVVAWLRAEGRAAGPVVVGRDARHGSESFLADTVDVLAGARIPVIVLPAPVPVPVLAWAVSHWEAGAGIMVGAATAGPGENGYGVWDGAGPVGGDAVGAIATAMAAVERVADVPLSGPGDPLIRPLDDTFLDVYAGTVTGVLQPGAFRRPPLDVAHTALHGTGAATARRVARQAGFVRLHEVESEVTPDAEGGSWPTAGPPPAEALTHLMAHAARMDADVALATSPGGERLAVAVPDPARGRRGDPASWRLLRGDEMAWLLVDQVLRRTEPGAGGVVVAPADAPGPYRALAAAHGVGYRDESDIDRVVLAPGEGPLLIAVDGDHGYRLGAGASARDSFGALLVVAELVSDLAAGGLTVGDRLGELARRFGGSGPLPLR